MRGNSFKRLLSAALACAMLAGNLPAISRAQAPAQINVTETETVIVDAPTVLAASSGTCGENVTWTLDANGTLTIKGNGDMADYYWNASPWFTYSIQESITSVVIESGVTSIGECAFQNCFNLTSVTIPEGVTSIGMNAFAYCGSLTSVTIPVSIQSIEGLAFSECISLTNVAYSGTQEQWDRIRINLGNSLLLYAKNGSVGGDCGNGQKWHFADNILTISGTGSMGDYYIDDSSRCAPPWFDIEPAVTEIVIQEGITTIGSAAFERCHRLTSVTIPESVTTIGTFAFYGCGTLKTVNYGGTKAEWDAIPIGQQNQHLIGAALTCVDFTDADMGIKYGCGDYVTAYLKNGTLTICGEGAMINYAFGSIPWYSARESITQVIIQPGVTTIGANAFRQCRITDVVIPNGITSIGDDAFNNCWQLSDVIIPDSVMAIGSGAFESCGNLTGVTIPEGVKTIGDSAFQYCNLTDVTIPTSVTAIGDNAFSYCGLASVNYNGTQEQWDAITMGDGNEVLSYVREYTQNGMIDGACGENLTWHLSDGTLTISGTGTMTDYDGSNEVPWRILRGAITDAVIEPGVTTIGVNAFQGCGMTTVSIPDSVTAIGNLAFDCCSNLTSVTIPGSVVTIGSSIFVECHSLTNVTISEGLKTIGIGMFEMCSGLTNVRIPCSVTEIGGSAFAGCYSLSSVNIPTGITNIGRYAFNHCSGLSAVEYSGTQEQWDAIAIDSGNEVLDFVRNGTVGGTCGNNLTWNLVDGLLTIGGTGEMADEANWISLSDRITKVVIQPGVTSIGRTFFNCYNLTSVTIPSSVTSIGLGAFSGCGSLTTVYYDGTREQWDAIVIARENGPLVAAEIVCTGTTEAPADHRVVLPWAVTTVENEAFMGNTAMTTVEIPAGVSVIGYRAFKDCSGLNMVVFDGSAPIIAPDAFAGVTATVRYPANDASWTASAMQSYGGNLTWAAYTE